MHHWKTITIDERDLFELKRIVQFVAGVGDIGSDLADGHVEGNTLECLAAPAATMSWRFLEKIEERFKEKETDAADSSVVTEKPEPLTRMEKYETDAILTELMASDDEGRKNAIHSLLKDMDANRKSEAAAGSAA